MDAFSRYNQIRIDSQDWHKTTLITHREVFGFKVTPFGLINTEATFQYMMDTIFGYQIGRNMQLYVNDTITKSRKKKNHALDLRKTMENMRPQNMRRNPSKCYFRLTAGKLLGFLVTQREIEADPS